MDTHVVELLLKTPNIDLTTEGFVSICALHYAVNFKNNEALKLLLDKIFNKYFTKPCNILTHSFSAF